MDVLGEIALSQGEAFDGGGNRPVRLADPGTAWYVVEGAVDVFVAQRSGGAAESDFRQLLRVGAGRLIFGVLGEDGSPSVLIAKGLPGSRLRRVPLAAFAAPAAAGAAVGQVDLWIADFAEAVARAAGPRPRPDRFLAAGEDAAPAREGVLGDPARRGLGVQPGRRRGLPRQRRADRRRPGLRPRHPRQLDKAVPPLAPDRRLVPRRSPPTASCSTPWPNSIGWRCPPTSSTGA